MAVYKCKMCGSTLEIVEGETITCCEYCNTTQTLPKVTDEAVINQFNRANNLRLRCEFDKAQDLYEKIIADGITDAEAYWGLILSKFGIEYVDDPITREKVPTCHRTQVESVLSDMDYKNAIEYADTVQRELFEKDARVIDKIQKEILEIAQKEEPFDVFICYKETDYNGQRTHDSVMANEIYHKLVGVGYKVFYAPITLENKVGKYEPYIYAGLNSAKIMLVIGTKAEYFNAVWVKNEWSRFLKLMAKDNTKKIVPCYKDIDAYDLPNEFAHFQAQDMGKLGFIEDLIHGIKKIVKKDGNKKVVDKDKTEGGNLENLLLRAKNFVNRKDFKSANSYIEKVLDINCDNSQAYYLKMLSSFACTTEEEIFQENLLAEIEENEDYKLYFQYATAEEVDRIEKVKYDAIYRLANLKVEEGNFIYAIGRYNEIIDYLDCKERVADAKSKMYINAQELLDIGKKATPPYKLNSQQSVISTLEKAITIYNFLGDYENSIKLRDECYVRIREIYDWDYKNKLEKEKKDFSDKLSELEAQYNDECERVEKSCADRLKEVNYADNKKFKSARRKITTAKILHILKIILAFVFAISLAFLITLIVFDEKGKAIPAVLASEYVFTISMTGVIGGYILIGLLHLIITLKQGNGGLYILNLITLFIPSFIFSLICLLGKKYGTLTEDYERAIKECEYDYERANSYCELLDNNSNKRTLEREISSLKSKLEYEINAINQRYSQIKEVLDLKRAPIDRSDYEDYIEAYAGGFYIKIDKAENNANKSKIVRSIKSKTNLENYKIEAFINRGGVLNYDFGSELAMIDFADELDCCNVKVYAVNEGCVYAYGDEEE